MDVELKGLLKKKVSKKGTEYYCVEVQLTPNYVATFFPTKAEVELINTSYGVNKNINNNSSVTDVFKEFE